MGIPSTIVVNTGGVPPQVAGSLCQVGADLSSRNSQALRWRITVDEPILLATSFLKGAVGRQRKSE